MTPANSLSWTAFVMTLAALTSTPVFAEHSQAPDSSPANANPIEHRLNRITQTLHATASQLDPEQMSTLSTINSGQGGSEAGGGFGNVRGGGGFANAAGAGGFGNARGGGGFVNTRGPGWVDGGGGGAFVNSVSPWRNGWADGSGFINRY